MTPAEMMNDARALLNDQVGAMFTNPTLLPYWNMATQRLQETFELNNIPVTNETSAILQVPANTQRIAFPPPFGNIPLTDPVLPINLIDIRNLWESPAGQNNWTKVDKRNFLPQWQNTNEPISQYLIYAWEGQEIKLLPTNSPNDLKLDYVSSILPRIDLNNVNDQVTPVNVSLFLTNWMAGLAAHFVGEDADRAAILYGFANESLEKSMGIQVKGQQNIPTRRRPFRAGYKRVVY